MQALVATAEDHEILRHRGRGEIRKRAVLVAPRDLARDGVDAEEFVFVVAHVNLAVRDRRGAADVSAGLDLLDLFAIRERDDVQQRVAAAENRHAVGDRGRAVDVIARFINPVALAGDGIDAVQLVIVAARENPRRVALRRFHPVGRAEDFVLGLVLPEQLAARRVERVEQAVRRADVNAILQDQRRGFDRPLGLEIPKLFPVRQCERVNVLVIRANEHAAIDDCGRGFHRTAGLEFPRERERVGQSLVRNAEQARAAAKHRPTRADGFRGGCGSR